MKEFAEKYQFLLGRQANIRVDGVNFQKKSRQIDVTKGVVCRIGDESDWETFHTGTECPE